MLRDRYKDDDKNSYAYLYQMRAGGEDSQANQPSELEKSANSNSQP
jgi:hypothetical protein